MYMIFIGMPFYSYAELYLGIYDLDRSCVRGNHGKDGRRDQCCTGFRGGCGILVHYDDRCDGFVGRVDGDRAEVRTDCKDDERDTAFHKVPVSKNPGRASGEGVYRDESDR